MEDVEWSILVGLGVLASSPPHLYLSTVLLFFPSLSYFVSRALEPPEPGTYGTFLARNQTLPRPLRCPRRKMRASHPGYRFGLASSSLPLRPAIAIRPHPPATSEPWTSPALDADLGGLNPPSLLPPTHHGVYIDYYIVGGKRNVVIIILWKELCCCRGNPYRAYSS